MVAGHLRQQNGIYQMILCYVGKDRKRKTKSISTHLPVKGNKKRAEAMLNAKRREFVPTLWNGDTLLWDYMTEWLDYNNYTPDHYAYYMNILQTYIVPYFKETDISIATLSVDNLEDFFKALRENKISAVYGSLDIILGTCYYLIQQSLDQAISSGWIEKNPCERIDPVTGMATRLFSDFILEWLEMMKNSVEETTYAGYCSSIKKRIAPYFAEKGYTLKDLENHPKYIQDYYQYELNELGLTTNTIIHRHANIRKCLQYAFQIGLISSNPADRIERPQKNEYVPEYYNAEELRVLFTAIQDDPLEIPILFGALYGMRRSEIVGLKWNAIDFDQKTILVKHIVTDVYIDGHVKHVAKDRPKNRSSRRTLPLIAPFEAALLALKQRQDKEMQLCGDCYYRKDLNYINRDAMGYRLKPEFISDHFRLILLKNNLKEIRFHDLRHSCASLLYAKQVDLKSIQEWLGHSTISTTANIYTHFDFSKKLQSANAILANFPALEQDGCENQEGCFGGMFKVAN